MAADGHLGCTKMAITSQLPIDVMFGSRVRFSAELRFYHRSLHTRTAVARNPCVSWALLCSLVVTELCASLDVCG